MNHERFHMGTIVVMIALALGNMWVARHGGPWEWINWTAAILCAISAALNGWLLNRDSEP
jgi:hypothetical protein